MPPKIVSPMAAIPKPDGDVRLIHDCSRPVGQAVNDYCSSDWGQKFSTINDAAALMSEGCYFAKVDLKSAYRSVNISQKSQKVTGLQWNFGGKTVFNIMRDTKLPFGAKLSVGVFHCASKRQLQSLAGRLSWAAGVVKGGRVFLRQIFDKINTLKRNSHKTILSLGVRQDIEWWSCFMQLFNVPLLTLVKMRPGLPLALIGCILTGILTGQR